MVGNGQAHFGVISGDCCSQHGTRIYDLPNVDTLFGDAPVIFGCDNDGALGIPLGLLGFAFGDSNLCE